MNHRYLHTHVKPTMAGGKCEDLSHRFTHTDKGEKPQNRCFEVWNHSCTCVKM